MFAAVPLTSCARAFHVLEYWMQCPHQEEKNWTSQAEDEFVTVGFRLLLLRITSGSSSVYRRAAARTHPGTGHRATAAINQNRNIPAVLLGRDTPRTGCQRAGELPPRTARESRADMRAAARLTATCVSSRERESRQTSHSERASDTLKTK